MRYFVKESGTQEKPKYNFVQKILLVTPLLLLMLNNPSASAKTRTDIDANRLSVSDASTSFEANGKKITSQFFPETGFTTSGLFYSRWANYGGLAINGFPISNPFWEISTDGQKRIVQYFERSVLEYHPDEPNPEYKVLLTRLGAEVLKNKYPQSLPLQTKNLDKNAISFEPQKTQHVIGGKFKDFWVNNGGLSQFGYPITGEFLEKNDATGKTYLVQYFERARLEIHPEYAGTKNEVQMGLFGVETMRRNYAHGIPVPAFNPQLRVGFSTDKTDPNLNSGNVAAINNLISTNKLNTFNWGYKDGKQGDGENLALVAGYNPKTLEQTNRDIDEFLDYAFKHPEQYPLGSKVVIGNEIIYDDGLSPQEYITNFAQWYRRLTQYGFTVGLGANYSPFFTFEKGKQTKCIKFDADVSEMEVMKTNNIGLKNFRDILIGLKTLGITPDFITQHAYPGWCNGVDSIEHFKAIIRLYHEVLKELNLQHLPMIINEYGLQDFNSTFSSEQMQQYLLATTDILMHYTDENIGNPLDDYHLVQEWYPFVGNASDKSQAAWWSKMALFDTGKGGTTKLWEAYFQMLSRKS